MNSTYSVQDSFCFLTFLCTLQYFYFQNRSITETFKAAVVCRKEYDTWTFIKAFQEECQFVNNI